LFADIRKLNIEKHRFESLSLAAELAFKIESPTAS
jgi:hypothetical protein